MAVLCLEIAPGFYEARETGTPLRDAAPAIAIHAEG
jgi:hypothetical protein